MPGSLTITVSVFVQIAREESEPPTHAVRAGAPAPGPPPADGGETPAIEHALV